MMLQLRQRSRSGGSSGDYVRVNSDDYEEDDDFSYQAMASPKASSSLTSSSGGQRGNSGSSSLFAARMKRLPKPSNSCVQCCWVFSLSGIIFLSVIAYLLASESPYIRVSAKYAHQKHKLVDGISGAIILYFVTLLICSYLWWRSLYSQVPVENNSRFID